MLSVYRKNTKNLSEQRIFILFVMLAKLRQDLQIKVQLVLRHCFDDELTIVREKEK